MFCSAPGEEEQLVDRINAFVAEVHDRMPVLLERKQFDTWMKGSVDEATALMKPAAEDVLNKWPVSKRVNSSRTSDEDETLIFQV